MFYYISPAMPSICRIKGQLQKPVEMLKNTPSVNSYLGA